MTQHDDLARLSTESRHPAASSLDAMDAETLLRAINAADAGVPGAVAGAIPRIARAVEAAYATIKAGGSLFYIGAGTSGRLGVLDASEIPPTYGAAPSVVRGLIAGGDGALRNSLEGAEDDPAQGAADLVAAGFAGRDMLIGVAASGRTPYVLGALTHARGLGAVTAAIACVAPSKIGAAADIAIDVETGPEIVAGSTRMKAGTAQKLILNMISTAAMIRLGKVYRGLMVDMAASNEKLRDRARRIVAEAAQIDAGEAARLLAAAGDHPKTAILMARAGLDAASARAALAAHDGDLRAALEHME